jgi:tripartite-type tricarboxylate transporter receptor subunit TctC
MKQTCVKLMGVIVCICSLFVVALAPMTIQAAGPSAIRLIVPSAAGSSTDNYARLLSDRLAKVLGKPVVVENIPGAGEVKAMQEMIRAPKDGSTIGVTGSRIVITPSIFKNLPHDPIKDLTAISIIGTDTHVLVVNPALPARSIKELIALAKSQPGKLNYGSAGPGSVTHLVAVLFCSEADVNMTHVPYKGGSQLMADLLGGHVEMALLGTPQVVEQVKAGKLRALGVSSLKRHPALPNVPTIAEAGVPGYSYDAWNALIGPANLPPAVIQRLNAALLDVLKLKEVQEALVAQGTTVVGSTPEEAARRFKADLDKNAKLVKQSGATFD